MTTKTPSIIILTVIISQLTNAKEVNMTFNSTKLKISKDGTDLNIEFVKPFGLPSKSAKKMLSLELDNLQKELLSEHVNTVEEISTSRKNLEVNIKEIMNDPFFKEFTTMSPQEARCERLQTYVHSMPFNIAEMNEGFYLVKMVNIYKPFNYRTFAMSMLAETVFFPSKQLEENKAHIAKLRALKSELIESLSTDQKKSLFLGPQNAELKGKSEQLMAKQIKVKIERVITNTNELKKLADTRNKLILLSRRIIQQDPHTEAEITLFKAIDNLLLLLNSCDFASCLDSFDMSVIKQSNLSKLVKKVTKLKEMQQIKSHYGMIIQSMTNQIVKLEHKNLKTVAKIRKLRENFGKRLDILKEEIKICKKSLKSFVSLMRAVMLKVIHSQDYKEYVDQRKVYVKQVEMILNENIEVSKINRGLDRLAFVMSVLDSHSDGDPIISEKIKQEIRKEDGDAKSEREAVSSLKQILRSGAIDSEEYGQNIKLLLNSYENVMKETFEQKDVLAKSEMVLQIERMEESVDAELATVFAKSTILKFNQDKIYCFGFIELGRNFFMMAKSNIIINFETFIRHFLGQMSTSFIRKFTISNYSVLVKPEYLRFLANKYHPRKTFELDEQHSRELMIDEFSTRFGFLVRLYRNKIDSVESLHRNKVLQGFTMFFHNGFLEIQDFMQAMTTQVLIEFLKDKILSYVMSVIPFISQIPILKAILMALVNLTLGFIIRKLVQLYTLKKNQIQSILYPSLGFIRKCFNTDVETIYLSKFFNHFAWTDEMSTMDVSNYDIQSRIYLNDHLNMTNSSDKQVFSVSKVNQIEEQYQTAIGENWKDLPRHQIEIFDRYKYYLSFKLFKYNSYLYQLAQKQRELNRKQTDRRQFI